MLFRQLEYFVALARERHFAHAADACHVSQPALSEAIRKLEHELKVPLVRRGQKFEGLTPEGERLVHWARRILADCDALKLEVTALQTGLVGELRLGVVPNAATTVALLTDSFCTAHPLVRVQLETNLRSAGIIERIQRFELDAGILYPDRHDTGELLVTPLYQEHQLLIVGGDLLPGKTESISWSDALALPLCLLTVGMRGRRVIDDALATQGLAVAPQLETDSVATLFAHVGTGRWASIVPHTWIRALGVPAGACVLRLHDPVVTAPMVLVTSAAEPGSVVTRALIEIARDAAIGEVFGRL
ncbi:LysR family transcriptional regulator [Mycobacterium montefiorense]|uniref:Transcriptional regulator, LysR family protein n=1 Tax=Mycobacterium montefiorense TaxID=154654 RepID=A0ABQ0NMM0_9MYCO|nr:LysR family transcriptional regulator [Mycobacterium montefiorense]GBG38055.1 transcriptional regulator, LysR family protein [Mycobacterium montefiorense]GKU33795.1 transcriptional regulator, LysR family protein [Mycobacterium montefiorense]GKU39915.1 transcriptional regulator, LysR family protein [Mycobacterium montefiorense]GKU43720.1 transcriptional regulator, LysR family protein [Mycobacterium montefiorense]GKU53352.1 transcriptional regulator, LysR family protein [Mycobacterium montefi